MAADYQVVDARFEHCMLIHRHARAADRIEIALATGGGIMQALHRGLKASTASWTLLYGDQPVAMGGVAPWPGELGRAMLVGIPWAIGTFHVEQRSRPLVELGPGILDRMLDLYGELQNYVHAENLRAIRFLGWLGFTFGQAVEYGPTRAVFVPFAIRRVSPCAALN